MLLTMLATHRGRSGLVHVYIHWYILMTFSWDPAKSEANVRERGFDFEFASLIFDGPTLEQEDRRQDYRERRVVAIGRVEGVELTVVYTDRQNAAGEPERRIISARRSNYHERQTYHETIQDR